MCASIRNRREKKNHKTKEEKKREFNEASAINKNVLFPREDDAVRLPVRNIHILLNKQLEFRSSLKKYTQRVSWSERPSVQT